MNSDCHSVAEESLAMLKVWPGYSAFWSMLADFPDLQAYLTGGVLRDRAADTPAIPRDFDIFLAGPSVDLAINSLAAAGDIQRTPFGSPRWFPAATPAQYCDLVSISRFTNGLGPCRTITDALRQFDFTGNALALDLRTGEFFDPVDGLRDMRERVMRMIIAYPDEPIATNLSISRVTVLWFRLLHYAAVLELSIASATLDWLSQHRCQQDHLADFTRLFFPPHPAFLRPLTS